MKVVVIQLRRLIQLVQIIPKKDLAIKENELFVNNNINVNEKDFTDEQENIKRIFSHVEKKDCLSSDTINMK